MTDFTVIIPTYKDWERLSLCVESVLNQDIKGLSFEIVVVDNEPYHNPPENLLQHPKIKLIHEPSPGSYTARNSGTKIARGKYLAFTDADCIPKSRWLINAKKKFTDSSCDMIGGRIELFKPAGGGEWAFIYEKHTSFRQHVHVKKGHSVTANLLVKKEVFEALNGFDSQMKSGGDWEFTDRAVSGGYLMVYGHDIVVQHPARKSINKILKKQKRFAAWGYLNVKKRYGHSGFRILGSQIFRGIPGAFKSVKYPARFREKMIVLMISLLTHFYKVILQVLFFLRIKNPEKIRE